MNYSHNGALRPASSTKHRHNAVARGMMKLYHHLWGGWYSADNKNTHTHRHTQDTYTPAASLSVISDRLTASASQQLNKMLQPPPSQPIDSENPPLAHTTVHAQSHADVMPIGTDLLIDLNSTYNKGHEDRLLLVQAAEHHENGIFLWFYSLIFTSSHIVFLLL